jgi:hypothetical protein
MAVQSYRVFHILATLLRCCFRVFLRSVRGVIASRFLAKQSPTLMRRLLRRAFFARRYGLAQSLALFPGGALPGSSFLAGSEIASSPNLLHSPQTSLLTLQNIYSSINLGAAKPIPLAAFPY